MNKNSRPRLIVVREIIRAICKLTYIFWRSSLFKCLCHVLFRASLLSHRNGVFTIRNIYYIVSVPLYAVSFRILSAGQILFYIFFTTKRDNSSVAECGGIIIVHDFHAFKYFIPLIFFVIGNCLRDVPFVKILRSLHHLQIHFINSFGCCWFVVFYAKCCQLC